MESIFLSDYKDKINYVYGGKAYNSIIEKCSNNGICYSKKDILENKDDFKCTRAIFSTWGMPTFTQSEIKELFPSLKYVFYAAGSVQTFARPFLNLGIKVFSAWAANAVPVAEYTVSQIILANKGFFTSSGYHSSDGYRCAANNQKNYPGNYGAGVGIIGAGMIGGLVIQRLKNYDLQVFAYDPFLSDERASELNVKKLPLPELFSRCNVVSNHLADNAETKAMLGYSLFSKMPKYATFINTGRGAQIKEDELATALSERPDITAILDVTANEPPLSSSPLWALNNCILTPHIAGSSGNEVHRMAEYMLEEYSACAENRPTQYEVTSEMLRTMA